MLRSSTPNRLCLACRIDFQSQQIWRQVSTSSAINRGLKATRDDQDSKRGGRDRSKRSAAPFKNYGDKAPSEPGFSRENRSAAPFKKFGDKYSSEPGVSRENKRRDAPDSRSSPSESRRSRPDRPSRNESGQQRRGVAAPEADYSNSERRFTPGASDKSNDGQDRPQRGLFKEIKSACKLVQQIQQREAAGKGVDGMLKDLNALLKSVNSFAESGSFKEEPSEALAALVQKHAADGTFVSGERRSSARTMISQKSGGKLVVSVGRGGPDERDSEQSSSSAGPRGQQESRTERSERRSPSDASATRRREASASKDADEDDDIPLPLPYTTAASEFLYGYNTVLAALKAKRRKLYRLYVHPKIFDREAGGAEAGRDGRRGGDEKAANEFVTLAKNAGVPFRNEFKTKLLDRMSDGRPHNGVLLEASKLPAPPALSLGKPQLRNSTIPVTLARQSTEEAEVNGVPEAINCIHNTWRHPFIVLLDGITDPGNLGNILRTCHFYGVDAVVVATNTCANLSSAVLAKASSGACEAVRLLSIPQPSNFVYESARNGWKIYASVAPTPDAAGQPKHLTIGDVATASPLAKHPCILMLGAEGEGLRENLRNRAHSTVSINRGKRVQGTPNVGVDSINVSVAAGVLMDAFLKKPADVPEKDISSELGF